MTATGWVAFLVAAAVGAPLRYLVDAAISAHTEGEFPWGTFVVNITGSLALGVITGLGLYHAFPRTPRLVLGTGFCGAYTTFSTFTYETVRLLDEGDEGALRLAFGYAAASLVAGTLAVAAGMVIASV